jgi:hypothetical protein
MTYAYYYTPCFVGQHLDPETGDPAGDVVMEPGMDQGGEVGIEFIPERPSGLGILKYDDPLTRCVVKVPVHTLTFPGWVPKTAGEILADYPGLPGVI